MERKPRLLDLFCGAGGCTRGYQLAGFHVTGVDINPQPRYCGEVFHQADALEFLAEHGNEFDAIHASPPCQGYSTMRAMKNAGRYPLLVEKTRDALQLSGLPWMIENVEQAPLEMGTRPLLGPENGIRLCGSSFGLRTAKHELRRHRLFESNVMLKSIACQHNESLAVIGFYGDHARQRKRTNGHRDRGADICRKDDKLALVRELMQIDWMEWHEAVEAIPPAYTEYLGRQLMNVVKQAKSKSA